MKGTLGLKLNLRVLFLLMVLPFLTESPKNLSHEHLHDLLSKSHPVQEFREFGRIFYSFRVNSRPFVAENLFLMMPSRLKRENPFNLLLFPPFLSEETFSLSAHPPGHHG
jgi:hypothetical protein